MKVVDRKVLAEYLSQHVSHLKTDEIEALIEVPSIDINFTYAFPCYKLAKHEKKAPNIIAEDLSKKLPLPDYIEEVEANGPYLNFRVKAKYVLENIFELKEEYAKIREIQESKSLKPLKIVVEYPSPNTNKPLHFGHIRNMLIGSTISNLFKYVGHQVYQVNLNNDRGIHICKSMLAYKKWGDNQDPDIKSDHFVGKWYVRYNLEEAKNNSLQDEVTTMLKLWEQSNTETRQLWEKMNKWALNGFKETYKELEISFDKEYFESDLYLKGKEKVIEGLNNGKFVKREDGAIMATLKDKAGIPDKVLLRSDGTSIYITQDIYLAYQKKLDFDYDKSIYVVGNEQDLYFKQLFAVLEMIGFEEDKYHFSYGMVSLPEGKMKSREGTIVDADDVIEEIQKLALNEVSKRYPDLSDDEKNRRAEIIGKAALRFYILKFTPKSEFVFNPKDSIAFEGETGPYIQYVYARIESITKKSSQEINLDINYDLLQHEKELNLIKYLSYFPEKVEQAIKTYGIHLIPQYLLTLCQVFNSFYGACIVISENKELERARLLLIKCVQIVIKTGLNLLDIKTLNIM